MKMYLTIVLVFFTTTLSFAQNYSKQWDKVIALERAGNYQSADKLVKKIYKKASTKDDEIQIVRTFFYTSKFAHKIAEETHQDLITNIEQRIDQVSLPSQAILYHIYATCLTSYFQKHRDVIEQRTAEYELKNDLTTWTASTFQKELSFALNFHTENKGQLKNVPLEDYKELFWYLDEDQIKKQSLYVQLLKENLKFYEQQIPRNYYQALNVDELFKTSDRFLAFKISAAYPEAFKDVVRMYQEIERINSSETNQLERIKYFGQDVFDLGKELIPFLNAFQKTLSNEKVIQNVLAVKSDIYIKMPSMYRRNVGSTIGLRDYIEPTSSHENHYIKANQIIDSILKGPKNTNAYHTALKDKRSIGQKKLEIEMPKKLYEKENARIWVKYKNIERIKITCHRINADDFWNLRDMFDKNDYIDSIIKNKTAIHQYEVKLPRHNDGFEHSTEALLPQLSIGSYLFLYETEDYNNKKIRLKRTLAVSNIQPLFLTKINGRQFKFRHRKTGLPIPKVKFFWNDEKQYETDEKGNITFIHNLPDKARIIIVKDSDTLQVARDKHTSWFENYDSTIKGDGKFDYDEKLQWFFDRSIYRPGQTVHFKAVAFRNNENGLAPVTDTSFEVNFSDQTSFTKKEVLVTNAFGSFSGSFIIPENGVTGRYIFQVRQPENYKNDKCFDADENLHPFWDNISFVQYREGYIQVEEYKRPVFEVNFDPNNKDYKSNDQVTVSGNAMLYSGNPLAHATVNYTVYVNDYSSKNSSGQGTLIKKGQTTTNKEGKYSVQFKAKPLGQESKPKDFVYRYSIKAEVIASTGERQEASMFVSVGKAPSKFYITVPEEIKTNEPSPIKIYFHQPSDNDKVKVQFYLLELFNKKIKTRFHFRPSIDGISDEQFEKLFPYEKNNLLEIGEKKRIKLVKQFEIDGSEDKDISNKFYSELPSGKYEIVFTSEDKSGKIMERTRKVTLIQSKDPYDLTSLVKMEQLNDDPKKDGYVKLKLSSFEPKLHLRIKAMNQIEKIYDQEVTLENHKVIVNIPVEGYNLFCLRVHYSTVFENFISSGILSISKRKEAAKLKIETKHLRNKIKPGEVEEWSFKVKAVKTSQEIEVLASMYDRSLDQLNKSEWNQFSIYDFSKHFYDNYYDTYASTTYNSKNHRMIGFFSYYPEVFYKNKRENVELKWYGFDMFNFKPILKDQNYLEEIQTIQKEDVKLIRGIVMYLVEKERWRTKKLDNILVEVKGTNRMTVTNYDGYYEIKAKHGETLVFSYPGYEKMETVINKNQIDLNLQVKGSKFFDYYEYQNVLHEENRYNQPIPVGTDLFSLLSDHRPEVPIGEVNNGDNTSVKGALSLIPPRTNFNETAFFYPHLISDEQGIVTFSFTAPESLTSWKLRLLAHNKELESGYYSNEIVTQKELMIVPNMPRFLRENDTIVIKASVTNLTNQKVKGQALLTFTHPDTKESLDVIMHNTHTFKDIEVDDYDNTTLSWKIYVPEGLTRVEYKIVAKTKDHSDGEQNQLPVLTNKQLITESVPLWIPPHSTKEFELKNLKNNTSTTLQHHQYVLEYATNPIWYAIKALPYLMEYEHECAEQTFARYYANTLAEIILHNNPKIKAVIDQWRLNKGEESELNESLKIVLMTETPWFRDLKSREEQNKIFSLLFDLDELKLQRHKTLEKLKKKQNKSGGFGWFDGGQDNRYITRHILAGLGHLERLNKTTIDLGHDKIVEKGIKYLDDTFLSRYQDQIQDDPTVFSWYRPYSTEHYLYTRSFYLKSYPISDQLKEAVTICIRNLKSNWYTHTVYQKAMLALVFERFEEHSEAKKIINQLEESAVVTDENGMYWKENKGGWYWYQAPIETQALLIEAFTEIIGESKAINDMKVWLIKNKQAKNWQTTKSTTEAIYALLLQGNDWVNLKDKTIFRIGGEKLVSNKLDQSQKEAATGYVKLQWKAKEITNELGEIKIENKSKVPGIGAVHWQYFENLEKVNSDSTKELFVKKRIVKKVGDQFIEIDKQTPLEIGDVLTVVLTVQTEQDIEYVHLKDMRASCFEPTDVISGQRYSKGIRYYKSTRDAATHFFFDKISKGSYQIEYELRVNNLGDFSNGVSTIQSMYAPEFSSHSKGMRVEVRE